MTTQADPPAVARPRKSSPVGPIVILLLLVGSLMLMWRFGVFAGRPKIAIVTSGEGRYWDAVITGANEAASQYDVDLTIIKSKTDVEAQKQAVKDLLATGRFDGVAVSPINPAAEAVMLADIAAATTLVTFDSDSPVSQRLCFVGTDNYSAGRHLGEYVKQSIPDGGHVVIVMGRADKENTQRRRQGVIDELVDRSYEPQRPTDDFGQAVNGPTYSVSTIIDDADPEKSAQMVGSAMKDIPNVKCFVGLLAYSTPSILTALEQANQAGKVQVLGFDMDERTLAGIQAGHVYATVMQDQHGLGYHTVRILAENARGFKMGLPTYQMRSLPVEMVTKTNVDVMRAKANRSPTTAGANTSTAGR